MLDLYLCATYCDVTKYIYMRVTTTSHRLLPETSTNRSESYQNDFKDYIPLKSPWTLTASIPFSMYKASEGPKVQNVKSKELSANYDNVAESDYRQYL